MIKQITVSNLYNFKNKISLDFVNSGNDQSYQHRFTQDSIANFSLVFGKNNIGKSNFFKILREVIDYIVSGNLALEPTYPILNNQASLFEIVLENSEYDLRYGFEINIHKNCIIDEWLFTEKQGIEDCVFIRSQPDFEMRIDPDKDVLHKLKDSILLVQYFQAMNHDYLEIHTLMELLKNIQIIDCVNPHQKEDLIDNMIEFSENKRSMKLLNTFLAVADLDIKEVKLNRLTQEEKGILDRLRMIQFSDLSRDEKKLESESLIHENMSLIPQLLNKDVLRQKRDYQDFSFIHRSGASYAYKDISSGSKQLIHILLPMIEGIKDNSVMIFDEIELGLHDDLVNLIMVFFKNVVKLIPTIQFIISTHRAKLLDYDFISNENKILFKLDDDKLPQIEYLSEYQLNPQHTLSQRYQLDAYGTNPDTSSEYSLLSQLQNILNGDK